MNLHTLVKIQGGKETVYMTDNISKVKMQLRKFIVG